MQSQSITCLSGTGFSILVQNNSMLMLIKPITTSMFDSCFRRRCEWVGRKLFNHVASHRTKIPICNHLYSMSKPYFYPLSYIPHSKISIINIFLTMHTIFLFTAYLSATLATPVAQFFDLFQDDKAATINNKHGIQEISQDFGIDGLEYISMGQEQAGGNDAPPFLIVDATTNYLQAQVPSQDIFSNFGGNCPSKELFCCRGGSGPPDSLITEDAFNQRCIPCTFYLLYISSKGWPPVLFC